MPATAPTGRFARRRAALDEDGHLLHRAAHGDDSAFEEFHDRHVDPLLHYCQHLLGSRHEAEDAVQQTFFNAYREISAGRLPSKPKAWLYAIARNRSLSIMRTRREHPAELVEAAAALTLTEEVEHRADLRELVHDLNRLPEDQRSAIVLFELADLPQADIADVIGREPEQVKSLVYQARSTLMARRAARAASCAQVQQEISVARRGQLNSRLIRNHVDGCAECAEYLDDVRNQRRRLAAIFPLPLLAASAASGGAGAGAGAATAGVALGRRVGQTTQVAAGAAGGMVVVGAIAATLVLGPGAEKQSRPDAPAASALPPVQVARAPARDQEKPRPKSRPRVVAKPAPPAAKPEPARARPLFRPRSTPPARSEPPPRRPPPSSEPEQPQAPAPNAPASEPEPSPPAAPPPTVVAAPPEPPPATSPPPVAPPPARHDNGNHLGQIKNGNSGNHAGQQR